MPVQRTVTLRTRCGEVGEGGRALCTFLSRAFPHFTRPGPIAGRREQREGGREAHPAAAEAPGGRRALPAAPADSSAAGTGLLLRGAAAAFFIDLLLLAELKGGKRRPAKGEKLGSVPGVSGDRLGPRDQDEK